ncbi:hypothetical protein AMELA_G00172360 [Ameiurus melas]|uniref:Uncharacterized protein n=1 Tax=Ameiurus melas TaxID=219545 RepID=A0A7J6AD42_AMEME|nr:hypothetical protein AMELA_G00172360 [Ameiurus melas]
MFIPGQRPLCETFSHKFWPKHPSSLPCESTDRPLLACRPVYTHFSLPLQPLPRLNRVNSPARRLNISQCGLRPSVKEQQSPGCQENLSIKGIPCFNRALPTKGPKQLHVFLPTEGTADQDDKDSESIDEGFMDEISARCRLLCEARAWGVQRDSDF